MLRSGFLIAFICLICAGCEKKPSEPHLPPTPVTAFEIQPHTIPGQRSYVGVAASSHIVQLRARVEGYLEKIAYVEGGMVKKGQLMFVLDQRPFIAQVMTAKGQLEQQEANLWNQEQNKNRSTPLYEANAISQKDYDTAISDWLSAKAQVAAAEATLYSAQLNLDFASISSPVDGLASQAKYREGALIDTTENLLTTIYVIDPIWVNFSVSDVDLLQANREIERGLLEFPAGMKFKMKAVLSDGSIYPLDGWIDFANPAIQEETGTKLFRAVFPNPKGVIVPGQFIEVIATGSIRPNAILVPQTAVVQGRDGPFVYVISDGKAKVQPVELGDVYKNYWVIFDGLKGGEVIVAEGVNKLHNEASVTVSKIEPFDPDKGAPPILEGA